MRNTRNWYIFILSIKQILDGIKWGAPFIIIKQGELTLRPFRSLVFILQLKRKFFFILKLIVTDSKYTLLCKYLLKVGFFAAEKGQFAFRNKIIEQGFTMLTIFLTIFFYLHKCVFPTFLWNKNFTSMLLIMISIHTQHI